MERKQKMVTVKAEDTCPRIPEFRYLTPANAGRIYRAMNGDKEAQKVVTVQDVAGLTNAPTFEKFLKWNRDRIEIVDEVEISR